MFRNLLIWGIFSFLIAAPTLAQETLRWKFEPETQWRVAFEQQSDIVTTVSSKSTTMTVHSGMELAWKVLSVEPSGNAVISQKLQQFRISLEMPKTGPVVYDSTSENKPAGDAKILADAVQPLLDAELKLTITPRGEITAVELDENAQKAVDKVSEYPALKGLLSKQGLINVFRHVLIPLPESEVKPGDEWTSSEKLDTPLGKIEQKSTYKLVEPDEKSAAMSRIESVSAIQPGGEVNSLSAPIATLREQEQRGLILFDSAAGELRSADIKQKLVTTSSLKDTAVQVRLTSTLKMSLERK